LALASGDSYPGIEITYEDEMIIATPGNEGQATLNLISVGSGTVEGIKITATSTNWAIKSDGDWDRRIGDLYSGHSTSILFNFQVSSSAIPGLYEIKFEVTTTNAGTITRYVIVKIEEPNVLDIESVTPSLIDIGETTTLVFNITNNGASDIGNILFTWDDASNLILPIGSDNRITVFSIPANNHTEIPIQVIASPAISPGVYPLIIAIEFYEPTGTKKTITSEVGVQVGGASDFEIVLQESIGGGTTFAIANIGANVASSVIVSIPSQLNYMVSGTSSVSLGNLDAGDYTLATFLINSNDRENDTQISDKSSMVKPSNSSRPEDFRDSGSRSNDLIVKVSYTDLFGVRQTVEKEVDFFSYSTSSVASRSIDKSSLRPDDSSGVDGGIMYIIIGVVGIIVIVAVLKIGKRMKK
jgi:hypothetical protein